jgi:hypothetical protein
VTIQRSPGSAAVTSRRRFNVRDFGALGDGTTDDSTAFQAAVDAAAAAGGCPVDIPATSAGTAYRAAGITLRFGTRIQGDGNRAVTITPPAGSSAAAVFLIPTGVVSGVEITDLNLVGVAGNTGQRGLYFHARAVSGSGGIWKSRFARLQISGFDGEGIWLRGGGTDNLKPIQFLIFEQVVVNRPTTASLGVSVRMSGQVSQITWVGGEISGSDDGTKFTGTNLLIQTERNDDLTELSTRGGNTHTYVDFTCQNSQYGIQTFGLIAAHFQTSHWENLSYGCYFQSSSTAIQVTNCYFGNAGADGSGGGWAIRADVADVRCAGNYFAGTFDVTYRSSGGSASTTIQVRGDSNPTGSAPVTSGLAFTITAAAILSVKHNRIILIGTSATAISTINSGHAPGELLHLKASDGPFVLATGGNLNLAGNLTPVTVGLGQVATLLRLDGPAAWHLVSISKMPDDDGLPGIFGPTMRGWAGGTAAALVSGTVYAYRIYPERDYTITLAYFNVSTASGTDDPCEIAVYDGTGTTKLATTGSTTGKLNSTGDKTITLSVSLAARTAYIVAFEATSTASVRMAQWNSSAVVAAFGSTVSTMLAMSKTGQSIPMPSALTSFSGANTVPLLVLRES